MSEAAKMLGRTLAKGVARAAEAPWLTTGVIATVEPLTVYVDGDAVTVPALVNDYAGAPGDVVVLGILRGAASVGYVVIGEVVAAATTPPPPPPPDGDPPGVVTRCSTDVPQPITDTLGGHAFSTLEIADMLGETAHTVTVTGTLAAAEAGTELIFAEITLEPPGGPIPGAVDSFIATAPGEFEWTYDDVSLYGDIARTGTWALTAEGTGHGGSGSLTAWCVSFKPGPGQHTAKFCAADLPLPIDGWDDISAVSEIVVSGLPSTDLAQYAHRVKVSAVISVPAEPTEPVDTVTVRVYPPGAYTTGMSYGPDNVALPFASQYLIADASGFGQDRTLNGTWTIKVDANDAGEATLESWCVEFPVLPDQPAGTTFTATDTPVAIPDYVDPDPGSAISELVASGLTEVGVTTVVYVHIVITHTAASDLYIEVQDPSASTSAVYVEGLPEHSYDTSTGLDIAVEVDCPAGGLNGTWICRVQDRYGADVGTIDVFSITVP